MKRSNAKLHLTRFWLALLALTAAAGPFAQQATERYIPLGQSAGVSGKTGVVGTVVSFQDGVLTLTSPAQTTPQQVRVLASTKIWIDHSAAQQTNMPGQQADLLSGHRVEVHFADPGTRRTAAWIKVQPGTSR